MGVSKVTEAMREYLRDVMNFAHEEKNMDNHILHRGVYVPVPRGVSVHSHCFGEYAVETGAEIKKHKHLVIHENNGRLEPLKVVKYLQSVRLGYHIMIAPDGSMYQFADLSRRVSHAKQCNSTGLGVCVLNTYSIKNRGRLYGDYSDAGVIGKRWWSGGHRYVLPTQAQLDTAAKMVPWLCRLTGTPLEFPTIKLGPHKPKITGWNKPPKGWNARPEPGVVAHRDFGSHADGRYILEHVHEANKARR
jgi:hypothetical protein